MKNTKLALTLCSVLLMTACNKSSGGGDNAGIQDGLCTVDTVIAYNQINRYTDSGAISRACSELKGLIQGNSCTAENISTGAYMNISYSDVKSRCEPQSTYSSPRTESVTTDPSPAVTVDPAIDSSGFCKQRVIDNHNSTLESVQRIQELSRQVGSSEEIYRIHASRIIKNCDELSTLLKGRSCVASTGNSYNQRTTTISESKFEKTCQAARDLEKVLNSSEN